MKARDLMTTPAITCHVNDPLNVAAQRMWDHDIGMLPVVNDDGVVTGVVTDRDVCMAAYTQGRAIDSILVNAAMGMHAVCVEEGASVAEIEGLMAKNQVRRIPVVDADHKPIGVVSLNDLAIESAQPDTSIKHGLAKIAHTLAAICRPRRAKPTQKAA